MKRWRLLATSCVCIVIVACTLLWRLEDHDLDRWTHESFGFQADGIRLAGTLWLPADRIIAAVVLVHGDGPQDRTSGGGYAPLVNALLDAGIAVASWDKSGVGASEGNWLDQSMEDRAVEATSALGVLTKRMDGVPIGALGFSQAGWVLPRLSSRETDFIILVGPAVSWKQQGAYYMRVRLSLAGKSEAEIAQSLARAEVENERLFGQDAAYDSTVIPSSINKSRWAFIKNNRREDAQVHLRRLNVPTLAIWGENDLNVDARENVAIYRSILAERNPANRFIIIPQATHSLLKASSYNTQLASEWPWYTTLQFLLEGRYAYAPGTIGHIVGWIRARIETGRVPLT